MSRHVPLVTSDAKVLREYFDEGTVFAEPTAPAVRAAVSAAMEGRAQLRAQMRSLHARRVAEWQQALHALEERLRA
jgi:lipase chaperone LimK